MKKIVVISGGWCTGKTRMANEISKILKWPVFSLDFFKEQMYDSGRAGQLNEESYNYLFNELVNTLNEDQSCIIESDFTDDEKVLRLIEISKDAGADTVQVFLFANSRILTQRFVNRVESGERHSGHGDEQFFKKAKEALKSGKFDERTFIPLELDGPLIKVDTSDFTKVDIKSIVNQIKQKF